ncbi:hypothetical protein AAMO2058_001166000 [Amorphochlora amoebiformis]
MADTKESERPHPSDSSETEDSDRAESRKARISVKDKKDRKGEKRGFSDRFKDKGTGRERSRERRLDNRSRFRDRGPMRERDRRGGRDRRIRNSRREGHRDKGSKLRSDGDSRRARPMRDRWGAKDDDDRAFDYIIPRNQLYDDRDYGEYRRQKDRPRRRTNSPDLWVNDKFEELKNEKDSEEEDN